MGKIMAIKESIDAALKDRSKPWTRYLEMAEMKTGVDRLYIFLGEYFRLLFATCLIIYYY